MSSIDCGENKPDIVKLKQEEKELTENYKGVCVRCSQFKEKINNCSERKLSLKNEIEDNNNIKGILLKRHEILLEELNQQRKEATNRNTMYAHMLRQVEIARTKMDENSNGRKKLIQSFKRSFPNEFYRLGKNKPDIVKLKQEEKELTENYKGAAQLSQTSNEVIEELLNIKMKLKKEKEELEKEKEALEKKEKENEDLCTALMNKITDLHETIQKNIQKYSIITQK